MKKALLVLGTILLVLVGLVLNIMWKTGFFRDLEPYIAKNLLLQIPIPGAEDLAISRIDSFLIVSSDDRAARSKGLPGLGGLYHIDLRRPDIVPKLLTSDIDFPFFPHGISMLRLDSSHYRIWAINHVSESAEGISSMDPETEHFIEVFDLIGDRLIHVESLSDEMVNSPNDIVALDKDRFYVTNDHGSKSKLGLMLEDYLGLARSNVVYFNGESYTTVADNIAYANGINYNPESKLLFVASPRGFLIKVFTTQQDGQLTFIENIDCQSGVDNIEFDEDYNLWVGCHPSLLKFASYASGNSNFSPSEIIIIKYQGAGDYTIDKFWTNNGEIMSASTVAIPFAGKVYAGNVMDSQMVILSQNE